MIWTMKWCRAPWGPEHAVGHLVFVNSYLYSRADLAQYGAELADSHNEQPMSDRFNAIFALESPFRGSREFFWAKNSCDRAANIFGQLRSRVGFGQFWSKEFR